MEHQSATPAPAGLVALAVACFCFGAIYGGFVSSGAIPLLACWLAGGFVIQFIVGLRELDHGALLGGNVFLYFSGFFMLATVFSLMTKVIFPNVLGIALDTKIEGFAWAACTLSLILWTPCYFKNSNGCMGLLLVCADIALTALTLADLGLVHGHLVHALIAYPMFLGGLIAIYVAAGIQLNTAFGRQVFNLLPPLIKPKEHAKS